MIFNGYYFNIINHSQSISYKIFTHFESGITKFSNFIILNCAQTIDHQLFFGPHELIHCFINIGTFGDVSSTDIFTLNTNTFKIYHFSTIFCFTIPKIINSYNYKKKK